MPLPQAELDDQQAVILTQMGVVAAAIVTADAADLLAQRKILAGMIAQLGLILLQSPTYKPPTPAGKFHDLIYQVAYALAPSF